MVVILDMGARNKNFLKELRKNNRRYKFLGFSAEPYWNRPFDFPVSSEIAEELIDDDKKGIYKIQGRYTEFSFPDESLDMVFVNSPHPLTPAHGVEKELDRCLKPGGIFFFGHSTQIYTDPFDDFELIGKGGFPPISWKGWWDEYRVDLREVCDDFPENLPHRVTPSETIRSNMVEEHMRRKPHYRKRGGICYMYNEIPLWTNFRVWRKN